MAFIPCEVSRGMRESERTVAVKDVFGRRQFLRVEEGMIDKRDSKTYFPIGVVGVDHRKRLALVELPHEADSGDNRLWVRLDDMIDFIEI